MSKWLINGINDFAFEVFLIGALFGVMLGCIYVIMGI